MASGHSMRHARDSAPALPRWSADAVQPSWLVALFDWKPFLVFVCLLPAVGLLLTFLPIRSGSGSGLRSPTRRSDAAAVDRRGKLRVPVRGQGVLAGGVLQRFLHLRGNGRKIRARAVARAPSEQPSAVKSILRAIILLPWIVPTVLSAIAFWWIYDPQFSIISYSSSTRSASASSYFDFLGSAWPARWSLIAANVWRGIPFVAISLLAGLQTISPSLYEAALIDGATGWQRFRYITFPLLLPILAIVMTFSIIFTFTDFQLVYAITRGGPVNSTHLMATLAFQRGIAAGMLGEGAAIAISMVPFLVFATLFSYFALARRKWQQGEGDD